MRRVHSWMLQECQEALVTMFPGVLHLPRQMLWVVQEAQVAKNQGTLAHRLPGIMNSIERFGMSNNRSVQSRKFRLLLSSMMRYIEMRMVF